jgi:hypothetical protein
MFISVPQWHKKKWPQCHFVRDKFQMHSPRCVGHTQRDVDMKEPETNGLRSPSEPDCRSVCIFTIRTQTHPLDTQPDIALPRTECGKNRDLMSHNRTGFCGPFQGHGAILVTSVKDNPVTHTQAL